MKLIAHRGFWWPRREMQNHPASVIEALSCGWAVEADVWGVHRDSLKIGHNRPEHELTMPADDTMWSASQQLFLHLKATTQLGRIVETLQHHRRLDQTHVFCSPFHGDDLKIIREFSEVKWLLPITSREEFDAYLNELSPVLISSVHGAWLEQPKENWVMGDHIQCLHKIGKTAWVASPELHGRMVDLSALHNWKLADGICTDFPALFLKVLEERDPIVHPADPWWT